MPLFRQAALIGPLWAALVLAACTEDNPALWSDGGSTDGTLLRDGSVDAPRAPDGTPPVDGTGEGDAPATDAPGRDAPLFDGTLDTALADAGPDGPGVDGAVADGTLADGASADLSPDYTVPDYTVPDYTVPDYTVPDYTVPDYTVPDFTLPDFTVPDGPIGDALGAACDDLSAKYADVLQTARRCSTIRGCSQKVDDELACPCATFVDPTNHMALGQLALLRATWDAWGCNALVKPCLDQCVEPSAGVCVREGGTGQGTCEDVWIQPQ